MLLPLAVFAQEVVMVESVKVHFRQGSSTLEVGYMQNEAALRTLSEHLDGYVFDGSKGKARVRISSSVSPEGSNAINDRLIQARAKSISDWVSKKYSVEVGFIVDSMGVDWVELERLVEASDKVPAKEDVLNIIHSVPEKVVRNGKTINERQVQLQKLQQGTPYAYIYRNFYPQLRYAAAHTEIWYAPLLTITSPDSVAFAAQGGQGAISYAREENDKAVPTISANAEWIGNIVDNGGQISFNVEPNAIAQPRQASIILNHYDNLSTVCVGQQAAEPIVEFVDRVPVAVDAIGGRTAVSFVTNLGEDVAPVVSCDAEWIGDINVTPKRISFTVQSNKITEPRMAVMKVECAGKVFDLPINQQAAVDKNSTEQAGDAITTPQLVLDRTESVRVYFRQGSSKLDQTYMGNGETLKKLAEVLKAYVVDDANSKGKVRIASSASPEGSLAINDRLAKARARAIAGWIGKRFNVEIGYVVGSMGIDWAELITLIEADDKVPNREEVLDLLYNTPERVTRNGKVINERQVKLERLRKGVPYRYIYRNIYPKLRYAAAYTEIWYASELTITTESPINVGSEGGDRVVAFKKNVDDKVVPRVTCTAEWIDEVVSSKDSISFKVVPNEIAEARSTKMYVECYGDVYNVVVNQEAAEPVCVLDAMEQKYGCEGGSGKVGYKTNTPTPTQPTAESTSEWISNVNVDEDGITYEVAPNDMAEARQGTIVVNYNGKSQEVTVSQSGAEPRLDIVGEKTYEYKSVADTLAFTTNTLEKIVPVVSSENEWIKDLTSTEDNISYRITTNRNSEARQGVVNVEAFDKTTEVIINQSGRTGCKWPVYMALKTNALYDLALVPNVGAELYLGAGFSAGLNWHYAWWQSHKALWCWRTYGGDFNVRYWFGKAAEEKPLTGHHVGLYGQLITYDFLMGDAMGIQSNFWNYGGGVEYGYSFPLAYRLNLDCTVGFGYNTGKFYEYLPIDDCYVWQSTKNRRYMGPTKLEVSLVWLIGCDNYNKAKGGNR